MVYSVKSNKSGATYYLHGRTTPTTKGQRTLYFFSKEVKEDALDSLPEGYVVSESATTGLPLLKKNSR